MFLLHPRHPPSLCSESEWITADVRLTFKTSGVEFDEELGSARCLDDGLDALKLNVGLL